MFITRCISFWATVRQELIILTLFCVSELSLSSGHSISSSISSVSKSIKNDKCYDLFLNYKNVYTLFRLKYYAAIKIVVWPRIVFVVVWICFVFASFIDMQHKFFPGFANTGSTRHMFCWFSYLLFFIIAKSHFIYESHILTDPFLHTVIWENQQLDTQHNENIKMIISARFEHNTVPVEINYYLDVSNTMICSICGRV